MFFSDFESPPLRRLTIGIYKYIIFKYSVNIQLKGDQDILFAMEHEVKRIPDITIHKLYDSHFFLITKRDDPLAEKPKVSSPDLAGRTLMIGGGSPPVLKALQKFVRTIQSFYLL